VLTVGVDLAAEPPTTATATIRWTDSGAVVESVAVGRTDDDIVAVMTGAAKVGLDCPVGWPEPFVEFLLAMRRGDRLPATDLAGRRLLAYRETDRAVTTLTGLRPLSVAADRIGHAAMRAVGILAGLAAAGIDVDRAGAGVVIESYPAAALRQWGLPHTGYKRAPNRALLDRLVTELGHRLPALDLGEYDAVCRADDNAFDAVVCALVARAAATGRIAQPTPAQAALAVTEGWIAVPTCPLTDLIHDVG
jgi:predicted nuclease with RNAse H fold